VPKVILVMIGTLPAGLPPRLARDLGHRIGREGRVADLVLDPSAAYDPSRGQFDSRRLLSVLDLHAQATHSLVLGIADVDLFSAVFTFVFGEAKLGGRAGLFSLYRLRPTLYGLPEDTRLLESRARKEGLHELGHLLGLVHCRQTECVMRFSGAVEEVDLKPDSFCPSCHTLVQAAVSSWGGAEGESRLPQDS